METVTLPYKIQIFIPESLRHRLKGLAHEKDTSLQKLVVALLDVSTDEAATSVLPEVEKYLAQS